MTKPTDHLQHMHALSALDWTAIVLTVIGALNWGLVGLLRFDLVAAIFGSMTAASRVVYLIVALAGIYVLALALMGFRAHHPTPGRSSGSPI